MISIKMPFYLLASWIDKLNTTFLLMEKEQLWFIIFVVLLITLYFIIKPVIRLLQRLGWNYFTTYVITILLFLNIMLTMQNQQHIDVIPSSISIMLLSIVSLGIIVMIIRVTQLLLVYLKRR
ncbi:hypothetical protein [Paraliobacillus salinarum]|uniref:hypothetical protein n=1 Tax=Paraliobacillus salinarum TaxID=1158996 RepID=UPI0015F69E2A|nr:hypothetical protein [Paraliobacillus salinarum]